MFRLLFRRAQATVDHAIEGLVIRVLVAVPFLVALGFGTAAMAIRINREFAHETSSLILAGAFAALGLVVAFAARARSEAPVQGHHGAVHEGPLAEPEIEA